ncbi:MAG: TlpA family protein disulfide reductase [Verrucomicrobiales bacterium]|nr:TlpA family protein disulfide reductase [Verrucomicrobiales bacterium]
MPVTLTRPDFVKPLLLAVVLACGPSVNAEPESDSESTEAWLTWRNGDELKGHLNPSPDERVSWLSPHFAAPLNIRVDQLESIRFPSTRGEGVDRDESQFRVYLNNGDKLEGGLVSMDDTTITVDCLAFEEPVALKRAAVERILHIGTDELRLSDPGDLTSWTSSGRDRKPTDWFTNLSGAFATHQWSGNLFRPIELPQKVEVAFTASFPRGKPELEIGLLKDPTLGPMLETWDNHLVLTFRTTFVPLMELKDEDETLSFRLFWNQISGEVRLCDQSGELLASLDDALVKRYLPDSDKKKEDSITRGFSILNRTPEMRLDALTIQEWDGSPAPVIDLSQPRLIISDRGPSFQVDGIRLDPGKDYFSMGSKRVPVEEFRELILPSPAPPQPDTQVTHVAWYSGTNVSGEFKSVDQNRLSLHPGWSDEPIALKLDHAKEIQFPESTTPPEPAVDHLTADNLSLYGTVKVLPKTVGESLLGWQPAGASEPIPFSEKTNASITRPAHPATSADIASSIGQARLFLINDEVLSGELISIEKEKVNFTSRTTGQIAIASELIRAIDIGSAGRVLDGFGDAEWKAFQEGEEQVELTRESASLSGGGFGNPSILLGDVVRFDAKWKQSHGSFTLRLFAESEASESPSTDIVVAAQGSRLYIGKLRESGAFSFSGEHVEMENNRASFRILTEPQKVVVFANDRSKPVLTIPINSSNVSGNGLYFRLGGGWPGWNQTPTEITFSDFRVERSPGSIPRRVIDSHSRERALTIPRIHRDEAPTHLLIAPNGDLLRGKLLSGVGNELRFESKGKTLDIPRKRVSTLIWLRNESSGENEEPASAPFRATHRFVLMDGSRLKLSARKSEEGSFVGMSEHLGECRISVENVVRNVERGLVSAAPDDKKTTSAFFTNWNIAFTPDPRIPGESEGSDSPLIGKPAPSISLATLDEEEKFSLSDHKGKVVVLDFWATWCGPCIKAMPVVRRVVDAVDSEDLIFCAINQAESKQIVSAFLDQRGWADTPVAFDFNGKVSSEYEVQGIPHTVVIDRDGKIVWIHSGFTEEMGDKLFEAIKNCL